MSNLNHADIVKQQYATETNLNTRIAIHEKYSTNKVGLWNISPSCFLGYGMEESTNKNFTLQNGGKILSKFFSKVEKLEYMDSLAVTNVNDMVEYIYSLSSMALLWNVPKQDIKNILIRQTSNGLLHVPKEYGMFRAA